jgi:hypothetical protein
MFFKTYGDTAESHYDQGCAVSQTEDGGYIVAGEYGRRSVPAPIHYYGDVYVVRTDKYGDTLWTKIYGDSNAWEAAYSMDKSDDGAYIISAFVQYPLWQLWLIKIDSEGDSLWSKTYPVGKATCIKRTKGDGYIITGFSYDEELNSDLYLLKINSKGDTVWLKVYDKSYEDRGLYVQQTSEGGYIMVGVTLLPETDLDIWLIKTDSQGDTLWTKTYGGAYIDEAHSICETKDGGYFLAGEYTEEGPLGLEAHIWLLKTNVNGDISWTRKINNGSWGDYANSMKKTSDGGFIIVGETIYDSFDSDIYLIKLDAQGNYLWSSTIGNKLGEIGDEKHYRGNDVSETSDGGYIITGFEWIGMGWDWYQDLCLLKVNDTTSVNEIPLDYALMQNHPNPFNGITQIRFQIAKGGRVTLKIYDLLGKEVITLLNEEKQKGTYAVSWDGKDKNGMNVSSGIYLYQLSVGAHSWSRKMLLIK